MANKKQNTIKAVQIGNKTYEIGKDKCTGISAGINNGAPIVTVYFEGINAITYTGINYQLK